MRYIVTDKDTVERTDTYLVKLTCADGTVYEDLEPRKLFPITAGDTYVTFVNTDEKEVALAKALSDLNESSREAVEGCFGDYYMIPVITGVLEVQDKFGLLKWRVMTDRGEIMFSIRNRHSDVKVLGKYKLFVRDSNDNRYLSDLRELDKKSMRLIFSYL